MDLNSTPAANRIRIGIFGRRNAGKSSIINAVTNQDLAIVSPVLGTTTDPVSKSMEILPLGPVVVIDTPGIDDQGELGKERVKKSYQTLNKTDIALVVADASIGIGKEENELIEKIKQKNIPYVIAFNKADKLDRIPAEFPANTIYVSAKTGMNIDGLRVLLSRQKCEEPNKKIIGDFLEENDVAVLVVPIDDSAPKGRLILPQQQTIRDILDSGAIAVTCKDTSLEATLNSLSKKVKVVITDSQVFKSVALAVPDDIYLTSFSILMSRYKGNLETAVKSVTALKNLKDGDTVLISEGCTHHRQCNDIGTKKIPDLIKNYTKKQLNFKFTSGGEFIEDLSGISFVVHCGGCMLSEREMQNRISLSEFADVPITNYGILIAFINGILKRSIEIFPNIKDYLE